MTGHYSTDMDITGTANVIKKIGDDLFYNQRKQSIELQEENMKLLENFLVSWYYIMGVFVLTYSM